MRKRIWMAIAAVVILGIGGMVYAHSVRSHVDSGKTSASTSVDDEPACPLGWLLHQCHLR